MTRLKQARKAKDSNGTPDMQIDGSNTRAVQISFTAMLDSRIRFFCLPKDHFPIIVSFYVRELA